LISYCIESKDNLDFVFRDLEDGNIIGTCKLNALPNKQGGGFGDKIVDYNFQIQIDKAIQNYEYILIANIITVLKRFM
jgi:hypothetical protein